MLSWVMFVGLSGLALWRWPRAQTVVAAYLLGWLVLPLSLQPYVVADGEFAVWVLGGAMPADRFWTKAAFIPATLLALTLLLDSAAWRRLRWAWADLPMLLWCLWPLLRGLGAMDSATDPAPWVASAYLGLVWGGSWALGRVYLGQAAGQWALLQGVALSAVACLPLAVVEGFGRVGLHGVLWGQPHPFREDGVLRRVGWRPIGMLENGNHYGLWVALGACMAVVVWCWQRPVPAGVVAQPWLRRTLWGVACLVALQAQSFGAWGLLALGWVMLAPWRQGLVAWLRRLLLLGLAAALLLWALTWTGLLPITHWARHTAWGQQALQLARGFTRTSLPWRISQEQKALTLVKQQPLLGHGRWDWWAPLQSRPWGLWMLMMGQWGLVGLGLAWLAVLGPPLRQLRGPPQAEGLGRQALAWLVLLAMLDGLMNSFLFYPALLAAAALVPAGTQTQGPAHPSHA